MKKIASQETLLFTCNIHVHFFNALAIIRHSRVEKKISQLHDTSISEEENIAGNAGRAVLRII